MIRNLNRQLGGNIPEIKIQSASNQTHLRSGQLKLNGSGLEYIRSNDALASLVMFYSLYLYLHCNLSLYLTPLFSSPSIPLYD